MENTKRLATAINDADTTSIWISEQKKESKQSRSLNEQNTRTVCNHENNYHCVSYYGKIVGMIFILHTSSLHSWKIYMVENAASYKLVFGMKYL